MGRSGEAAPWSLFSAGGVVAAFLMPVTILLTSIVVAAGWLSQEAMLNLLHHPLTRLYLFVVIAFSLFHAMHRLRFVLADLGLKPMSGMVAFLCYGIAAVGALLAVVFLLRM